MAYVGQTRSAKLVRQLWERGIGECTARGELPPRRRPWFYDNGAFGDWKAKRPFDRAAFEDDIRAIRGAADKPDFIVLPDIVAGGSASLAESRRWVSTLFHVAPLYLAVQDGMTEDEVRASLQCIAGLFVGGTLLWKIRTGPLWVKVAREAGIRCHIGRCGTPRRVAWARRIGADSLDSALPLWSRENLDGFLSALKPAGQREMFAEVA